MKFSKVAAAFALTLFLSAIGHAAGGQVDFSDQAIVKVSAKKAPASVTFEFGGCFTVVFDRSSRIVTVTAGEETQQGTVTGTPSLSGGFIALFYHDGDNLATIIDYEQDDGEWESVTVHTPFPSCSLSRARITGQPSNDGFSGVRAFVTADLKQQIFAQN